MEQNWLYYKLYAGPQIAEEFLTGPLAILIKDLIQKKLIRYWFFIRYIDPDYHLRIRLFPININSKDIISEKMDLLTKPWTGKKIIWKIQNDIYKRETERYGQLNMHNSEMLFYQDSEIIIHFLQLNRKLKNEEYRWVFSLFLLDLYFEAFNFNINRKYEVLRKLRNAYYKEFHVTRFLKSQIDQKYRNHKKQVEAVLSKIGIEDMPFGSLINEFKDRIFPVANKIITCYDKRKIKIPIDELVISYIHMSMNRLFRTRQRLHELIIYDFAFRYYESLIARKKHNRMK